MVAGTDLTHNLPDRETLIKAIQNVPLVVSFAERVDDFASFSHFVCPDHHPLESWMDAEPVSGVVSLTQPTLHPLGNTRSILESLNRWMGRTDSAYDTIQAFWRDAVLPRVPSPLPFQDVWDQALHDGFVEVAPLPARVTAFQADGVRIPEMDSLSEGFCLTLYSKVGLTDSRHAHNPWLQELPDPITKATWDNYVCVSPAVAAEYGLTNGDLVHAASSQWGSD